MLELSATTEPGARLVALAERLAEKLAPHAAEHDKAGSFPFDAVRALQAERYFAAPIPVVHGGLGADSVHDVLVAASRLARGDASVAIGVNMHLVAVLNIVRRWSMARASGNARRTDAFAASMHEIAERRTIIAGAVSEPGQDLTRPATTATRHNGGWTVEGRKIFCTMSPAATILLTAVRFVDDDGLERYGYAQIPAAAPGVVRHDDWDGMGMRASGSNSVSLEGVEIPAAALRGGFPTGDAVPYMERNMTVGLFHASASLGIAEAAHAAATAAAARRGGASVSHARSLASESAIELAACRASLAHTASLIDAQRADHPASDPPGDEIVALFTETQAAKTFINAAATRVVDRSLTLSGGAAYLNGHPLGRAYRDVRAGSFMHPLATSRAHDFVADVALGGEPSLH